MQLIRQLDNMLATSELLRLTCTIQPHTFTNCPYSLPTLLSVCRWFSIVLYLVFLFVVIVVLLNLLIAQMSNTYSNIQDEAEATYAVARARILSRLEKTRIFGCGEVSACS